MTTVEYYFKIRNFEEFQHYSKRNPPWIRLYYRLLHDRRFFRLDDQTKYVVIGLFLIASQNENRVAADPDWIFKELSISEDEIDWQSIVNAQFIIPIDCNASDLIARLTKTCSHSITDSSDNTEQKTETEILSISRKSEILAASDIFKHWNSKPKLMHHRKLNGQEKSILSSLKHYTADEIKRAIDRYSIVRQNLEGKYRNVYQWTLGEFVSRESHKNLERFNAEEWEQPFLSMTPTAKQPSADWLYTDEDKNG